MKFILLFTFFLFVFSATPTEIINDIYLQATDAYKVCFIYFLYHKTKIK